MIIALSNLAFGKWLYITDSEIEFINNLIANLSKTEEASFIRNGLENE